MCNKTKWFGIYFSDGKWLHDGSYNRIVFDNEEEANIKLSNWQDEGKWLDAVVKSYEPAPHGCVLYS